MSNKRMMNDSSGSSSIIDLLTRTNGVRMQIFSELGWVRDSSLLALDLICHGLIKIYKHIKTDDEDPLRARVEM